MFWNLQLLLIEGYVPSLLPDAITAALMSRKNPFKKYLIKKKGQHSSEALRG